MNTESEARCSEPTVPGDANIRLAQEECAKEIRRRDVSYIDPAPEKQVVLSDRLEYLARRVGGCQTEELLALLRRLVYEAISQRKY